MKRNILILLLFTFTDTWIYAQTINSCKLDSFLNYVDSHNQEIGKIVISQKNKIYTYHFKKTNVINPSNAKYRIGSISKMLTAIITYKLIDNGKLSLIDTLSRFFPDIPNAKNITIKHLLNHTSGLGDFVVKQDTLIYWLTKPVDRKEIYQEIKRQHVYFQPGADCRYSNTGYFLLARILEKVSGKTYSELLNEYITKPLNLKNTLSGMDDGAGVMQSYCLNTNNDWSVMKDFYYPNIIGVGDIISTPEDLNSIITAIFDYKLISKKDLDIMLPNKNQQFGCGMMAFNLYGNRGYGHEGDTFGSHSVTFYDPDNNIAFSMCLCGSAYSPEQLLINIINIVYNKPCMLPIFPTQYKKCNIDQLKKFTGIYENKEDHLSMNVFIQGNDLMAVVPGQPSFTLEAYSETEFGNSSSQLRLIIKLDENNIELVQRGLFITLHKVN